MLITGGKNTIRNMNTSTKTSTNMNMNANAMGDKSWPVALNDHWGSKMPNSQIPKIQMQKKGGRKEYNIKGV